jgi:cytochrome c biogenesis protein CcmG/thiol:disulfide interchange protein DsbE
MKRTAPTVAAALVALAVAAIPALAQSGTGSDRAAQRAKEREEARREKELARRLEKLDDADRRAVDASVGFECPAFPGDLAWIGSPVRLADLRGKVVVIQTFTTKGPARTLPERVAKSIADLGDGIVLVAVHTPEAIDKAKTLLEKDAPPCPVLLDTSGAWCDAVGAFKRPVNILVGRNGDVRAAGLTPEGAAATAKELMQEEWDVAMVPTKRPETPATVAAGFPKFTDPLRYASDLRGRAAPAMGNVNWEFGAPNMAGKLVLVDFWATWCGPCLRAIPHMNEIANAYPQDVCVVGISSESNGDFRTGLLKENLKRSTFAYAVGNSPGGPMEKAFGVRGIPHVAAISSDGIVRWQGSPSGLTPDLMRTLVEANRGLRGGGAAAGGGSGGRWKSAAK